MKLIIEWLDKYGNPLVMETTPHIKLDEPVQMLIVPKVKTVINFPGHASMHSVLMDETANRHFKESVTALRIRIKDDDPEKKVNWLHTFEFKGDVARKETALLEAKDFIENAAKIERISFYRETEEKTSPMGVITKSPSGYEVLTIRRRVGGPSSIASAGICECCVNSPVQYTLKDPGKTPVEYHVCANCLPALVNTALTSLQFFNLLRNGHTVREHLLHGDFYDDETGKALQPR